jgi:hypothetical protein
MNSTSTKGFCLPLAGSLPTSLGLSAVAMIGALQVAACGSDSAPPATPDGGAGQSGSGGGGGNGAAGSTSSGGAASGACKAPAPKIVTTVTLQGEQLFAAGSDLYLLDASETSPYLSIWHVKDDGTGKGKIYSPPEGGAVQSFWVDADTIYFVERTDTGLSALYRSALTGTGKTRISKTADGFKTGGADIAGVANGAVFVSVGASDTHQLRRIAVQDGTETVIADQKGLTFKDIQIVGSDMWYLANQGLDGYFKTPLTATGPSGKQVGTEACTFEASVTSAGAYCADAIYLSRMPLTGSTFMKVWNLPDGPVDVSMPDGNFVYLTPKSTPDSRGVLRKYPVAGGNPTDISCDRSTMTVPVFNDKGVYWLEETEDASKLNVYSTPK